MNVRTPAMLLLALVPAGCSGTVPYSSTISETDVSYARETIIHASTALQLLDDPTRPLYVTDRAPYGPMAAGDFVRRTQAEVRALSGVLGSVGLELPSWTDIRRHGAAHPDPRVRSGRSPVEIAAAADQALVRRSLDYIDAARSGTLRHLARRAVDRRLSTFGGNR